MHVAQIPPACPSSGYGSETSVIYFYKHVNTYISVCLCVFRYKSSVSWQELLIERVSPFGIIGQIDLAL